jgi:hypothetical protein
MELTEKEERREGPVEQDFEEDLNVVSTPRLRLLQAQFLDIQTQSEAKKGDEDETELLESILEQNNGEVAHHLLRSHRWCRSMLKTTIFHFFASWTQRLRIFKDGKIGPRRRRRTATPRLSWRTQNSNLN